MLGSILPTEPHSGRGVFSLQSTAESQTREAAVPRGLPGKQAGRAVGQRSGDAGRRLAWARAEPDAGVKGRESRWHFVF